MRKLPRRVQAFILMVMAGGGAVLLASLPNHIEPSELTLLVTLALSGVLSGLYPLPLVHRRIRISITGGILLMAVFLTTPTLACVLTAVVSLVSGVVLRRRPWNILFMAGVNVLAVALAGALYDGIADRALLPLDSWSNALALGLGASAYWLTNSVLVNVLVAARNDRPFLQTYVANWREVYLECILLTLLGVMGAAAWHQGPVYAFLLLVPAVAVYQLLSITKFKQEQVIKAIGIIAEVLDRRNPFTFQHSYRVAEHTRKLATHVDLSKQDVEILGRAALIHDIGKLGEDDSWDGLQARIGSPTGYQFYNLKQHAQLGAMIAREIPAFEEAEETIRYHHDWYDGSHVSKPHSGEEIPLGARIIAIADAYDRLCMANGEATLTYDPMAIEQLRLMKGRQLDPGLLTHFLDLLEAERSPVSQSTPVPQVAMG